jgi:hypothetical protein
VVGEFSGFRRGVFEVCAVVERCVAWVGSYLQMFREPSIPSFKGTIDGYLQVLALPVFRLVVRIDG